MLLLLLSPVKYIYSEQLTGKLNGDLEVCKTSTPMAWLATALNSVEDELETWREVLLEN